MDGLTLATTASASSYCDSSFCVSRSLFLPASNGIRRISRRRELRYFRKSKFVVFGAAQDDHKFDQWDQMELKFGSMLSEDPKLTLAKIMAKKANPDVSFLEVEKQFYKNKGKIVEIKDKKPSNSLDGMKLIKPVSKVGFEFHNDDKPLAPQIKKPNRPLSVPNFILRKPALYVEDDVEDMPSRSRVRIKPNLTLKNDQSYDKFSDMTLLRKPEPSLLNKTQESLDNEEAKSNDRNGFKTPNGDSEGKYSGFTLLKQPEATQNDDGEAECSEIELSPTLKEQQSEDFLIVAS